MENLDMAMEFFNAFLKVESVEKEEVDEELVEFLKKLVDIKNVEIVDMALEIMFKTRKELKELFKPISIAVEIVKTRDIHKYYDIQVERREIVVEILKKLTGSIELLPEEYR